MTTLIAFFLKAELSQPGLEGLGVVAPDVMDKVA